MKFTINDKVVFRLEFDMNDMISILNLEDIEPDERNIQMLIDNLPKEKLEYVLRDTALDLISDKIMDLVTNGYLDRIQ